MILDTTSWAWPQWTMVVWFILVCVIQLGLHGTPVLHKTYTAGPPILRWITILFVLTAGGFFK